MKALQIIISFVVILFGGFNTVRAIATVKPAYALLFTALMLLGAFLMRVAIKELKED